MTDFVVVSKGHRLCRNARSTQLNKVAQTQQPCRLLSNVSLSQGFDGRLKAAIVELTAVGFADKVVSLVKAALNCDLLDDVPIDIVCYGLGSFTTNYVPCYQLALLELLRTAFAAERCTVFDPLFNAEECRWLETHGYSIPATNTCGKYVASHRTIFYMPHCGRPLYNNVLFANWSPRSLERIVLIGNSFRKIDEGLAISSSCPTANLFYIRHCLKAVKEVGLPSFPPAEDAFNDTAIHSFFASALLSQISPAEWSYSVEPDYNTTEFTEEIILR